MFNVLALYPNMAQQILEELRVEPILVELQFKRVATTGAASSVQAMSASDDGGIDPRASMITTRTSTGDEGEKTVLITQKKSKTELWNELKILSMTKTTQRLTIGLVRTLTLIYSLSALVLLSRIQFNLLGRQAYVASILALAPESTTGGAAVQQIRLREESSLGDLELQRSFLSFSWWLIHRGWKMILTRVHTAVDDVFSSYSSPVIRVNSRISPKDIVTAESFRTLLHQVREQIEYHPAIPHPKPHTFLSSLLPPTPADEEIVLSQDSLVPDTVSEDLRRLLDEASDVLESPASMTVFHILLDRSIEEFVSVLEVETKASRDGIVRLANYLPVATKEAEKIAHGVPNQYFQVILFGFPADKRQWRK
jgi:peroxin-3